MEMLYVLNHWHWWALATLFVLGEILAPCVYFMAIGIAAALVGLVTRIVIGIPGLWQLGLFVLLALMGTGIAHSIRTKRSRRAASEAHGKDKPSSQTTQKQRIKS